MNAKRDAFVLEHQPWIDFLNQREEWKEKNTVEYHWKSLDGKKSEDDIIDLTILTQALQKWQRQNYLTIPLDGGIHGNTWKFKSEKQLIMACAEFMYRNLRIISRGEGRGLEYTDQFTAADAMALLSNISLVALPSGIYYDYSKWWDADYNLNSYLPRLSEKFHGFMQYITHLIHGLRGRVELGIYKIGVCPYQRRKETECGKVFVGKKYDQAACEEHAKRWQYLKTQRNKRKSSLLKKSLTI